MPDINEPVSNENIGGYNTVQFVESYGVASVPDASSHVVDESSITLEDGYSWSTFYGTPKTILPEFDPREEDGGVIWPLTLKMRYPKEQASVTNTFLGMQQKPYLIKITGNNGEKRLLGSIDNPMKMFFKILNPGEVAGYNGYEVQFSCIGLNPPYYLE